MDVELVVHVPNITAHGIQADPEVFARGLIAVTIRQQLQQSQLLRGMSLRLLKFSGGSVDDYAICRSS